MHVKGRTPSSTRWLQRHATDEYVRRAEEEEMISRAAYKLQQMQEKWKFLRPGDTVIDLGSAPGGWTKVAHQIIHPKSAQKKELGIDRVGKVISVDLKGLQLDVNLRHGLHFIRQDFTLPATKAKIKSLLDGKPADVLLSDMFPVASGDNQTDHLNCMVRRRLFMLM